MVSEKTVSQIRSFYRPAISERDGEWEVDENKVQAQESKAQIFPFINHVSRANNFMLGAVCSSSMMWK
jgi:hypothetical protein